MPRARSPTNVPPACDPALHGRRLRGGRGRVSTGPSGTTSAVSPLALSAPAAICARVSTSTGSPSVEPITNRAHAELCPCDPRPGRRSRDGSSASTATRGGRSATAAGRVGVQRAQRDAAVARSRPARRRVRRHRRPVTPSAGVAAHGDALAQQCHGGGLRRQARAVERVGGRAGRRATGRRPAGRASAAGSASRRSPRRSARGSAAARTR